MTVELQPARDLCSAVEPTKVHGICTDSGARLPSARAVHLGVEVVSLTITIDDQELLEGVEVTSDEIEEMLAGYGARMSVAEPSPGQFAAAYGDLVQRRIAVGTAGAGSASFAARVADAISRRDPQVDVVGYKIGVAGWIRDRKPTVGGVALGGA